MKTIFLGPVLALLVGASTFGVYKSVDLFRKNGELEVTLGKAEKELSFMKESLNANRVVRIQLEEDLNAVQVKMDQKEKEERELLRQIKELTAKTGEAEQTDVAMASIYSAMSDQIMRLEFENAVMRRKMSSVHELKKAIKEVKIQKQKIAVRSKKNVKKKALKRRKVLSQPLRVPSPEPVSVPVSISEPVVNKTVSQEITCNEGYLIKDGKSTFEGVVEIKVTPAEAGIL